MVLLLALIALSAIIYYFRLATALRQHGGSVDTEGLVSADLLVAVALALFFGQVVFAAWSGTVKTPSPPLQVKQVLPNSLLLLVFAAAVAGFLAYRGANLNRLLGLFRVPIGKAVAIAVLMLLAAFPIILLVNHITVSNLKDSGVEEQQLVSLFRRQAQHRHYSGVAQIVLAGVVLAPAVEEFLFRGFFYPVFKKYLGAVASALLTAGLFAAFHMNLASLPGLFALALCLTLAFERTGSLLVPIAMHGLFNLSSLALLYLQARHPF